MCFFITFLFFITGILGPTFQITKRHFGFIKVRRRSAAGISRIVKTHTAGKIRTGQEHPGPRVGGIVGIGGNFAGVFSHLSKFISFAFAVFAFADSRAAGALKARTFTLLGTFEHRKRIGTVFHFTRKFIIARAVRTAVVGAAVRRAAIPTARSTRDRGRLETVAVAITAAVITAVTAAGTVLTAAGAAFAGGRTALSVSTIPIRAGRTIGTATVVAVFYDFGFVGHHTQPLITAAETGI